MKLFTSKIENIANMNAYQKEILISAINSVTRLEAWDDLKKIIPQEDLGFSFDQSSLIRKIENGIYEDYDDHSGGTIAWTMRQLEFIAKNGIDDYVLKFNSRN